MVKGKVLGRRRLAVIAGFVTPDTILPWYRQLVATKYDGSNARGPFVIGSRQFESSEHGRVAASAPRFVGTRGIRCRVTPTNRESYPAW